MCVCSPIITPWPARRLLICSLYYVQRNKYFLNRVSVVRILYISNIIMYVYNCVSSSDQYYNMIYDRGNQFRTTLICIRIYNISIRRYSRRTFKSINPIRHKYIHKRYVAVYYITRTRVIINIKNYAIFIETNKTTIAEARYGRYVNSVNCTKRTVVADECRTFPPVPFCPPTPIQ